MWYGSIVGCRHISLLGWQRGGRRVAVDETKFETKLVQHLRDVRLLVNFDVSIWQAVHFQTKVAVENFTFHFEHLLKTSENLVGVLELAGEQGDVVGIDGYDYWRL